MLKLTHVWAPWSWKVLPKHNQCSFSPGCFSPSRMNCSSPNGSSSSMEPRSLTQMKGMAPGLVNSHLLPSQQKPCIIKTPIPCVCIDPARVPVSSATSKDGQLWPSPYLQLGSNSYSPPWAYITEHTAWGTVLPQTLRQREVQLSHNSFNRQAGFIICQMCKWVTWVLLHSINRKFFKLLT